MCAAGSFEGNPISPASAEKYRNETDFFDTSAAPLSFKRIYRSNWAADDSRITFAMGQVWTHNHTATLKATPWGAPTAVAIASPEGSLRNFTKPVGGTVWSAVDNADSLVQSGGTWLYRRADDDVTFNFDASGKLQTQVARNGWTTVYTYDGAGRLSTVTNPFGRSLVFAYTGDKLTTVTASGGKVFGYLYDAAGRLSSVTYPDNKTRTFVYENAAFPQALTGIFDETGARWGTFAYDTQGKAISTELAGAVERYQVSYPSTGSANVIDPLGTNRSYSYGTQSGKLAVTSGSLPSGTGEADASSRVQDANGLITREADFNGVATTTTWDSVRRLPLTVVRAAGTPDAQTTTTQWHATFSLPVLVTEAGRSTAYTYDALGRLLSETVTDTLVSPNTTRTSSWTYTPQGLVATATAPNGGVTTYTYDTAGNALKVTRPLGHVTSYTYDSANRVVSQTAPNGLVITYTWDARDRLLTQTVGAGLTGAQTTTLTYKPTGLLATMSLPTGLVISYSHDAAHRLTGWTNNRGESGSFTLDAMGNRTSEQIKDNAGAVAWAASTSVNAINRVATTTQGQGTATQSSSFVYDANGERTRSTNGLNQSTQFGLDGLRRVTTLTDPANATARLSYNALDDITTAKDFKGVTTSYGRDVQGNATIEASADAGQRVAAYDALGLPSQIVDAMGQATQIQRDALGRPTQLSFADGKATILRYDLTGGSYNETGFSRASRGHLSEIIDRSGNTVYKRDAFGRVTVKSQTLANGHIRRVRYTYAVGGDLDTLTYPNGERLNYLRDSSGRVVQMNWNDKPLVTGITWNPLGQPTAWHWAFADDSEGTTVAANRTYDTAGRLVATEFSSYVYDAAGRITSLTQNLWKPANANPAGSAIDSADVTWSVGYDAVGRIVSFGNAGSTATFGYDANGNRTTSSRSLNGQSTTRIYAVSANRPTGFSQIAGGTSTNVAYNYNANGDLVGDGLKSYSYDAEGRLSAVSTGATEASPTTRYAHNALGQRVFKTDPLFPDVQGDGQDPGFFASLTNFFTRLWSPGTSEAEQLGFAYVYDEDGSLIGEYGMGGASSASSAKYMYLPTASGPMPIMAFVGAHKYAAHSDHLNTPRRLTRANGRPTWQWAYTAFGDEEPTTAAKRFSSPTTIPTTGITNVPEVTFNLRYPGQYADVESGLFYNANRSYNPTTGRYTQTDPIGLAGSFIDTDPVNPFYKTSLWFDPSSAAGGGINRFIYGNGNPLSFIDPDGLQAEHTKNARPSTEQKHQDAEARRQRDAGGEKGDQRRRPPSKRPPGYKGPWPIPGIIPLICPLCEVMEPQPLPGPELCQGPSERRES